MGFGHEVDRKVPPGLHESRLPSHRRVKCRNYHGPGEARLRDQGTEGGLR